MCGITCIASSDSIDLDIPKLSKSLHLLTHRGPDNLSLTRISDNVLFGHSRLSINDLSDGSQPLQSQDQDIVLIANAEIYNCHEILSSSLDTIGYKPRTNSDCEAIIAAYKLYGHEDMFFHIRGMYSFVLYDRRTNFLLIARDHVGIKPLYYCHANSTYSFASEAKAIAIDGEIMPFPSGSYQLIDLSVPLTTKEDFHVFSKSYSTPDIQYPHLNTFEPATFTDNDIDQLIAPFKSAFEDSVRLHMLSDVPICLFLSGGLDSAILCAAMDSVCSKYSLPKIIDAYCVGDNDSADFYAAQQVAKLYNLNLHQVVFDLDEAVSLLPTIIYSLETDEAEVIRSSITNYFLAKQASQKYKVVLTGEGSDELFGGYLYFHDCKSQKHHLEELYRIFDGLSHANLCRVDKMTMAHSLEARVPFLDPQVIKQAFLIPNYYKMIYESAYSTNQISPFSIEKWILRRAYRDVVPSSIINRAKAGQCEGYSDTFVPSFTSKLLEEYSHYILGEGDPESEIYSSIFNSLFNTATRKLIPRKWPGNCRASGSSWDSDKAKDKGLAPSRTHLWRGIKM